jgi:hypothetical protein|tara:strand:+ start:828 stop:932 length:105 start_codon:yes stop_codon:yes gene_type:complete
MSNQIENYQYELDWEDDCYESIEDLENYQWQEVE